MKKNEFQGIWIPKYILTIDVTYSEKFIMSIIDGLSKSTDGCYAKNKYFGSILNLKNKQVSRLIKGLEYKGFLIITYPNKKDNSERKIFIDYKKIETSTLVCGYSIPLDVDNHPLVSGCPILLDEDYSNNITNNIINKTSSISEKLKCNINLINLISKELNISNDEVINQISVYSEYILSIKKYHTDDTDLFKHFNSWIKKQKLNNNSIDIELEWFIKMFNKRCKGKYRPTKKVADLFAVQLENGFTGDEMKLAVENLFSSNNYNKFHKETGFKFATPVYLLKDDNLNKYLNLKKTGNINRPPYLKNIG